MIGAVMRQIDGFVFDLDGTIYLGEAVLPGSVECVGELRRRGKRTAFITNKPLEPRGAYADKLTRLGIPTSPDEVITAAFVLGRRLAQVCPALRFYVVGEQNLQDELRGHGLTVVDAAAGQDPKQVINPAGIDAVIVAFDRTLDYRKLNTAYQALCRGARFFATNADKACPMPGGSVPDAGATLAALEHITGRRPELMAGKPSPVILQVTLEKLDLPPERCMMVGDRLETDILMGQQAGMATALVLTGVSTHASVEKMAQQPDFVFDNLYQLLDVV
jgi:NagD protein